MYSDYCTCQLGLTQIISPAMHTLVCVRRDRVAQQAREKKERERERESERERRASVRNRHKAERGETRRSE
jgi:hypothetical protein